MTAEEKARQEMDEVSEAAEALWRAEKRAAHQVFLESTELHRNAYALACAPAHKIMQDADNAADDKYERTCEPSRIAWRNALKEEGTP